MSHTIVPAIIPASLAHIESVLSTISAFTKDVQIDVVDGKFVPFISWPYGEGAAAGEPRMLAPYTATFDIEIDFMIANVLAELPKWQRLGIKRAVVHIESCDDLARAREIVHAEGALLGLSSNNDTSLATFLDSLQYADYAQCMGIAQIGSQGQPFDEGVLERIRAVKERYPDMEVAVDGSVNITSKSALIDAGATRLISGSAILHAANPQEAYRTMCH